MTDISALESYAGQLSEAAQRSNLASELQHRFVHGGVDEVIQTESGPLPSLAKWRADLALLETTLLSFDEIVERCGYSDASSFRKLFKRATSLTPADYRERFRLRAA